MRILSLLIATVMSVAITSMPAWAGGSKVLASLVPTTDGTAMVDTNDDGIDDTLAPVTTISSKSKFIIKSNGLMKGLLKDITDPAGNLVTTDGSYKASGTLTGDEYVIVIAGKFFSMNVDYAFVMGVEAKKGKGATKLDGSGMFGLIPEGVHRASSVDSIRVYGPIGAENVDGCQNILDANGTHLYPDTTPNFCIGQQAGDPFPTAPTVGMIGSGGMLID
jgi:hypothetical protein